MELDHTGLPAFFRFWTEPMPNLEDHRKLTPVETDLVRDLSRKTWIEEEGNLAESRNCIRATLRNGYGTISGTGPVGEAIKHGFGLVKHWSNAGIAEPPSVAADGEPGASNG